MQTFQDRLLERMNALRVTQTEITKATGASRGTVSLWCSGNGSPNSRFIDTLSRVLECDVRWLLTGESLPYNAIPVHAWDSNTPLDDDEVEIPFYKDFHLSCGVGLDSEATALETRRLRMSKLTLKNVGVEVINACAMTANGDSMSPVINDRDTIYVDKGRKTIKDGKIFAINHDGMFKCKYLYNLPKGGIRVVSANSFEYPEERLTAEEIIEQDFKIEGWVFSCQPLFRW